MSGGADEVGRGRAAGAACFVAVCRGAAERARLNARYNSRYAEAEFTPLADAAFRSRTSGFDTGLVRVLDMQEGGGLRGRTAWRDDALGAWFAWGPGGGHGRSADTAPQLVVAGPGTEVPVCQQGDVRVLRVSVRGEALQRLAAAPTTPAGPARWSGVWRPEFDAVKEWRLQQTILRSTAFAAAAAGRGVDVAGALEAAAEEVVAELRALLRDAAAGGPGDDRSPFCRRRLVERAVAVLESADDEPASVATVCRTLGVGERTLQRAFQENLGLGLRAYERRRRLRGVHGAILTEGDRRSITDIAMHFGFWHLGRFAGAYAAMFGCPPSETRERIWGARRPADASTPSRCAA